MNATIDELSKKMVAMENMRSRLLCKEVTWDEYQKCIDAVRALLQGTKLILEEEDTTVTEHYVIMVYEPWAGRGEK